MGTASPRKHKEEKQQLKTRRQGWQCDSYLNDVHSGLSCLSITYASLVTCTGSTEGIGMPVSQATVTALPSFAVAALQCHGNITQIILLVARSLLATLSYVSFAASSLRIDQLGTHWRRHPLPCTAVQLLLPHFFSFSLQPCLLFLSSRSTGVPPDWRPSRHFQTFSTHGGTVTSTSLVPYTSSPRH